MNSACVSVRKSFLAACLTLYTAARSFKHWKAGRARMAENAAERDSGEVPEEKTSTTEPGAVRTRLDDAVERVSGDRLRRAMARFPWEGWARIRAIPVPLGKGLVRIRE